MKRNYSEILKIKYIQINISSSLNLAFEFNICSFNSFLLHKYNTRVSEKEGIYELSKKM